MIWSAASALVGTAEILNGKAKGEQQHTHSQQSTHCDSELELACTLELSFGFKPSNPTHQSEPHRNDRPDDSKNTEGDGEIDDPLRRGWQNCARHSVAIIPDVTCACNIGGASA